MILLKQALNVFYHTIFDSIRVVHILLKLSKLTIVVFKVTQTFVGIRSNRMSKPLNLFRRYGNLLS